MKKKKKYNYGSLVNKSKNIIITILMEKKDEVLIGKIDTLPYYVDPNEDTIGVRGCFSSVRLCGSRAPYNIKELLTWKHLYKMRKQWLNFFFPYYKMFIPKLTKKMMWSIILDERRRILFGFGVENKKSTRKKDRKKRYSYKNRSQSHYDNYHGSYRNVDRFQNISTKERLYPLSSDKYLNFFKTKTNGTFKIDKNRAFVDQLVISHPYKNLYAYNNFNIEFDIIDGHIYLLDMYERPPKTLGR